jgi:uncharacterized protein (TIGR00369 family)
VDEAYVNLEGLRSGRYVRGTAHSRALEFELVSVGPREGIIKMPWREAFVGEVDTGVIAGGAVTALLDHAGGLAVLAALTRPGFAATLDLRIDYQRPAVPGRDIFAHAYCYRITRSVAFVRASAYETDPADPVATIQATYMLTGARESAA